MLLGLQGNFHVAVRNEGKITPVQLAKGALTRQFAALMTRQCRQALRGVKVPALVELPSVRCAACLLATQLCENSAYALQDALLLRRGIWTSSRSRTLLVRLSIILSALEPSPFCDTAHSSRCCPPHALVSAHCCLFPLPSLFKSALQI